jgi:peptidyl-prolyl cis-trans isomerase C
MRARILVVAAVLCVSACAKHASAPTDTSSTAKPDPQAFLDYYIMQKTGVAADKVDPQLRASLAHDLEELKAAAAAEAIKADTKTQNAIELQRIELLARAGAAAAGVFAEPSDAELKSEYDRYTASLPAREFHVAHILVATESAAQILITKLQGGADFAQLAREQSADDSKARGGDIGWIAPGKLPVEFTNAVQSLKSGQITARPVHTIYGWHVIKLLESGPATPPPFDQVKAQLAASIQQARYKQFLESAIPNAITNQGR